MSAVVWQPHLTQSHKLAHWPTGMICLLGHLSGTGPSLQARRRWSWISLGIWLTPNTRYQVEEHPKGKKQGREPAAVLVWAQVALLVPAGHGRNLEHVDEHIPVPGMHLGSGPGLGYPVPVTLPAQRRTWTFQRRNSRPQIIFFDPLMPEAEGQALVRRGLMLTTEKFWWPQTEPLFPALVHAPLTAPGSFSLPLHTPKPGLSF